MTGTSELASPAFIQQDWAAYTAEDHKVWGVLYARRMEQLRDAASKVFHEGIAAIDLSPDTVPDLRAVNARLEAMTGWRAVAVNGFLEANLFFRCLAQRRFPTTTFVRPMAQLEYLPEPDIFHDVFGHVPLHSNKVFADFLQHFGGVASCAANEEEVRMLTRLFWFTVEFGLIREDGRIKVYGSGLISSMADCANALGPNCERRPFSLDAVMRQEFGIDHLQSVLFVVESFDQLFEATEEARRRLDAGTLLP